MFLLFFFVFFAVKRIVSVKISVLNRFVQAILS